MDCDLRGSVRDAGNMTVLEDTDVASDSETQRVNDAIDALLAAHDPRSMDDREFRGARFDAGLAWVHFAEGDGGLGVRPELNRIVDRRLREAGAKPTDPRTFFMALAGPTIATHGSAGGERTIPASDVHGRGEVVPAVLRARCRI